MIVCIVCEPDAPRGNERSHGYCIAHLRGMDGETGAVIPAGERTGYYTTPQAASVLGVSVAGVRWHIKTGNVRAVRSGGRLLALKEDVDALAEARSGE